MSWARESLTRQVVLASALMALVLGVVFAVLLDAIGSQRGAIEDARRAEEAVRTAARVEQLAVDLETGERGFVITGDRDFLEPYSAARRAYDGAARRLVAATNTPESRSGARRVAVVLDSYAGEYLPRVVAAARRDLGRARAIVATGAGKEQMDRIRAELAELRARESDFLATSRAAADRSADRAVVVGIGGAVLAALLVAALVWFLRRSVVAPAAAVARSAERIAAGDLAARSDAVSSRNELGQMNRAFNQMAESLERAAAAAREAEAARDEFFALVSHELRTPLTSIVGYVELLAEDADGTAELTHEERARFLEIVNRNSRRLLRLVGDLLFVARLEAGRLELDRARFDLDEPVRDSLEAGEPRAARAHVTLRSELEGAIGVEGDEGRIGQAVDNLLSNAIKFTPAGGEVTVRTLRRGGEAVVEVADTGVGIPPQEQERLFERFFRASTGVRVEGVGLGLAITLAIAEGHGGRLEVESEPGRGSTFRLVLPLAEAGVASGAR